MYTHTDSVQTFVHEYELVCTEVRRYICAHVQACMCVRVYVCMKEKQYTNIYGHVCMYVGMCM